jgi:putative SOS response-associated peptidase YedK
MSGRFAQNYTWQEIQEVYDLIGPARNIAPRYNIGPVATIHTVAAPLAISNTLIAMRWGSSRDGGQRPSGTFLRRSMFTRAGSRNRFSCRRSNAIAASSRRPDTSNGRRRPTASSPFTSALLMGAC